MRPSWPAIVFGSGAWTLWYGSLFLAFLMLLATGLYACVEPSGPGAGPMLMLMRVSPELELRDDALARECDTERFCNAKVN